METDVIGRPLSRIDGRQKVTGAARYAAEFDFPNLAHAVSVPSTIANGRIAEIDTRDAEASPGVLAVITYRNAPKLSPYPPPENQNPSQPTGQTRQGTTQREGQVGRAGEKLVPLQDDRIYYSGQYIAVVVAETLEQA